MGKLQTNKVDFETDAWKGKKDPLQMQKMDIILAIYVDGDGYHKKY